MRSNDVSFGNNGSVSQEDKDICIIGNLGRQARDRPDHAAIEDGERTITYGELDYLVGQAAANLKKEGVGAGDYVALMLNNSADHLVIMCALVRLGSVVCSINLNLSRREISENLGVVIHVWTAPALQEIFVDGRHRLDAFMCPAFSRGVNDRWP